MAGPSTGAFNEAVATPGQLPVAPGGRGASWLDKERIIAGPGFNRWVVPPAALAIHLCIGMAYGFSVFWLPLSKMLQTAGTGAACGKDMSFFAELFATGCDWRKRYCGHACGCRRAGSRHSAGGRSCPRESRHRETTRG